MTAGPAAPLLLASVCPASMWLLGAPVNCTKGEGHDGPHEIVITWTTGERQ